MKETANFLDNEKLTLIEVAPQSEAWYEFRKSGIGGSEVAAACGKNKYQSKLELFLEKIGFYEKKITNQEPLVWGTVLEKTMGMMAEFYDGQTKEYIDNWREGKKLRTIQLTDGYVRNSDVPWLFFSPDGIIHPGQVCNYTKEVLEWYRGVEVKTIDPNHARMWEGGWPKYYEYQMQSYMIGLGCPDWEMVVFNFNRTFYGDLVPANEDMQREILEDTYDLWHRVEEGRLIMEGIGSKYENKNDPSLIMALDEVQPDLSDDNPDSLNEFLSRNAKMLNEKTRAGDDVINAAINHQRITKIVAMLEKEKTGFELDMRRFMDREKSYFAELVNNKGEDKGYIKLGSRVNTDKLTLMNKVRESHDEAMDQMMLTLINFMNT
jgi:putative phage-type endonuclease